MNRLAVLVVLVALASVAVSADDINLGEFPLGSWLDPNYDAVWEFSTGNIRILAKDGSLHYDFGKAGIEGFKVSVGTDGPFITFSSELTGKSYKLSKPLTKPSILLEITRPELPLYTVEMPKR